MNAPFAPLGDSFRVSWRSAWAIGLCWLLSVIAVSALATRMNLLPAAIAVVLIAVVTIASFKWPLLSLALFAAFIPIEAVVLIDGVGTVSRLAGVLFAVTYGVPRLGRLKFGSMPPAGWAFVVWAVLSLGWAIDPATAWAQLPTLIQLFLIAVVVADFVVQRPDVVRPVLWIYSLSAAVTALIGTQYFLAQGTRAIAIEHTDPAQFAAVLLPALVFSLHEILAGRQRILGGAVALVTTAGVVVSGTRGAWVAVAVVVLLFVLPRLTMPRRLAAIAIILVLVVSVYQLPGVSDLVTERSESALSTGGAGRTDIWTAALTIFKSAPVTGVGYANFPVAFTPEVIRASDVSSWKWLRLEGAGPHNVVVSTTVELGPIGLLLLVLFLGPLVLRRGWGPDAASVQAILASLLTMALFLDILAGRKQVWLAVGIAAGLAFLARRNREAPTVGTPMPGLDDTLTDAGRRREIQHSS
jgi:O-antigen ligase